MKKYLVFSALFILLLGCVLGGAQKKEPSLAKTPYLNQKYGFAIYPPESWEVNTDSSGDEVDFSFDTGSITIKAKGNPGAGNASYAGYCESARWVMSKQQELVGGSAPSFSGEEVVYVSGIKACKVSALISVLGQNIAASYTVFGKGDTAYYIYTQISSLSSEEEKNYYEKSFNLSIASLELS